MKSRQINFFVMPDEWEPLENYLKENNLLCISRRMKTKELEYHTISDDEIYKYVIKPSEVESIKNQQIDNELFFITIENPVIEFIKPRLNEELNTLKPGRFYYTSEYWDENNIKKTKDLRFIATAEELFKWFKKNYKTVTLSDYKNFVISDKVKEKLDINQLSLKS